MPHFLASRLQMFHYKGLVLTEPNQAAKGASCFKHLFSMSDVKLFETRQICGLSMTKQIKGNTQCTARMNIQVVQGLLSYRWGHFQ